jgi:hypothetical protein
MKKKKPTKNTYCPVPRQLVPLFVFKGFQEAQRDASGDG